MKLTLRKANALQLSIAEAIKSLPMSLNIAINEFQNVSTAVTDARQAAVKAVSTHDKLLDALYLVRKLIGRANADSGIADLLTAAARIDKQSAFYKTLSEGTEMVSEAILTGKLDKIRNRKDDARHYGYDDTVATGVFSAAQIADFKTNVAEFKRQKQQINDKVLELNIRTEIELDDATVAVLQSNNLI